MPYMVLYSIVNISWGLNMENIEDSKNNQNEKQKRFLEKVEIFKQKYPNEWKKFEYMEDGEKLFYEYIKAKEKLKQAKEKIQAISEKERKREARALIIFAKLVIKHNKDFVLEFLSKYPDELVQKERGKEIDYSKYILKLLEQEQE